MSVLHRPTKRSYNTHRYYAMEHDPSHGISVGDCAYALGTEVVESVTALENVWLLRATQPRLGVREEISDDVLDAFKTLKTEADHGVVNARSVNSRRRIASSILSLRAQSPSQRVKRVPVAQARDSAPSSNYPTLARDIAERFDIQDPLFIKQWHLVNDEYPEHMMNVAPVWNMGYTGKGVITAFVDDGLDYTSEDIADNFDATGSYDFNDHEDLPTPKLWDDTHGTRCAGQVSAVKNGVCGVGIAYDSKVAGIRILSGPVLDVDEAAALNFGFQNTSIYSCSWGPTDDGRSMGAPTYYVAKAIQNGVQNGRGGKGSVFVFASGNGAYSGDQCNFDGYTNSIYSVTVAAVDYTGFRPYYSEACAANMVVTYSSGNSTSHMITTSDVGKDKCTDLHGGTSAAAPNAAGVFALALSARPELSWRDIQYLCVKTAQIINPDDPSWETMASGRRYSYQFGFGRLDAYEYVKAALDWPLVKPQAWIEMPEMQLGNGTMSEDGKMQDGLPIVPGGVNSTMEITKELMTRNNFESLEHITVTVWISHHIRGDVEVELISPHGIHSMLAEKRPRDFDEDGFPGWTFMSLKHWGEDPTGNWTIRVSDQEDERSTGDFIGWRMSFWGSSIDASKAKLYEFRDTFEKPFPSSAASNASIHSALSASLSSSASVPSSTLKSSTTKVYEKPTHGLASNPLTIAKVASSDSWSSSTPTLSATQDVTGEPSSEDSLLTSQNRLAAAEIGFGLALLVLILFLGGGIIYWRRSRLQSQNYMPVDEQTSPVETVTVHTLGDAEEDDEDDSEEKDSERKELINPGGN